MREREGEGEIKGRRGETIMALAYPKCRGKLAATDSLCIEVWDSI